MLRVACRPPGSTAMLPSEPSNYFANGVLPNGGAQKPSPPSPLLPAQPLPLSELCSRVHERVATFLTQEVPTQRLRSVQEQTRISLCVIQKALRQYKYGSGETEIHEGVVACSLTTIAGSQNSHCLTMVAKIAWFSSSSFSLPSTTMPNSSIRDKTHIRFRPYTSNPHIHLQK